MGAVRRLVEQLDKWVQSKSPQLGTIDIETAERAAHKLKTKLGKKPWLLGVGVGMAGFYGFYISVIVKGLSPEIWSELPTEVDGIAVKPRDYHGEKTIGVGEESYFGNSVRLLPDRL